VSGDRRLEVSVEELAPVETGWHRHDSGEIHRDSDPCTWLGNPTACDPPAR
jgi:hypothetical protein